MTIYIVGMIVLGIAVSGWFVMDAYKHLRGGK